MSVHDAARQRIPGVPGTPPILAEVYQAFSHGVLDLHQRIGLLCSCGVRYADCAVINLAGRHGLLPIHSQGESRSWRGVWSIHPCDAAPAPTHERPGAGAWADQREPDSPLTADPREPVTPPAPEPPSSMWDRQLSQEW